MQRKNKPSFHAGEELMSQLNLKKSSGLPILNLNNEGSDLQVLHIPVNSIITKENPRTNFDMEAIQDLARTIEMHGLLQPITVRKIGNEYELIAGERRYRAFKLLKKETIPAILKNVEQIDPANFDEIKLIENLQREDLTDLETAVALVELKKNHNYKNEKIAERLGQSEQWVKIKLAHAYAVETLVSKGYLKPTDKFQNLPSSVWNEVNSSIKSKPKEVADWIKSKLSTNSVLKQAEARDFAKSIKEGKTKKPRRTSLKDLESKKLSLQAKIERLQKELDKVIESIESKKRKNVKS